MEDEMKNKTDNHMEHKMENELETGIVQGSYSHKDIQGVL